MWINPFAVLFGIGGIVGYVIYWNLTHQREIREALKSKQKNELFESKLAETIRNKKRDMPF